MSFNIGDKVIHCTFGLGDITQMEEKNINGSPTNCYVVQINDMTIWVPADESAQYSIRLPTPPEEFKQVLEILVSPNEPLPKDKDERKHQLLDRLKDGKLSSVCQVVRDLSHYRHTTKLNDNEKYILERAIKSLLTEWTYSLGVSHHQALLTMESMLKSQMPKIPEPEGPSGYIGMGLAG